MKQELKSGFEVDAICARHEKAYLRKAGVTKSAKRQLNKRRRREWKQEQQENESC